MTIAERIEKVQAVNMALARGDLEEFRKRVEQTMHEDGEWVPLIGAVEGRPYRGPDGMVSFFRDFLESFDVEYEGREFRPLGDTAVLFLTTMHVSGRGSGVAIPRELGVIFEFDGDRVRLARAYDSHAKAIEEGEQLGA